MNTGMFSVVGHNRVGFAGETLASQMLQEAGYLVRKDEHGADLLAIDASTGVIVRIEVKAALTGKGGFYSFCLNKKGHTSTAHADVVLMFCVKPSGEYQMYCAPASAFSRKSSTRIAWGSKKYLSYRCDCLDLIDRFARKEGTR